MSAVVFCKLSFCRIYFGAFLLLITGCGSSGPELAPVNGRVTLDGKPLEGADIEFQPDNMLPPSVGHADADGRFELMYKRGVMGARLGPNTVRITVSPSVVKNAPTIPPRYNKQSELREEVKAGSNEFNFDLKSEPK